MAEITVYELIKFLEVEKATDFVGVDYILALMEDEGVPSMLKVPLIMQCISEAIDVINEEYEPKELGDIEDIGDVEEGQIIPMEHFVFEFMGVKYEFRVVLN